MSAPARTSTVQSGDVSIAVAERGEPGRPPVVLIHGYPDTKEVWDPVAERLAAQFHVVAYDVRGAGASGAPDRPAGYDLERLGDDFAAVCEAAAPGRPVHLVGHDWGGIQGWEFTTQPRFAGRVASFTSIAGPALAHAVRATRRPLHSGRLLRALNRARRSWYVPVLCTPGGPSLTWRLLLTQRRWRWYLDADGVPTDEGYPAATLRADGLRGANLYRRNIMRRAGQVPPLLPAHAPVSLIVPAGDRYISPSYYDAAAEVAPGLRRRTVPGSHWAIRTQPELIADWIAQFVHEVPSSA